MARRDGAAATLVFPCGRGGGYTAETVVTKGGDPLTHHRPGICRMPVGDGYTCPDIGPRTATMQQGACGYGAAYIALQVHERYLSMRN